jgi:hypothetical protein
MCTGLGQSNRIMRHKLHGFSIFTFTTSHHGRVQENVETRQFVADGGAHAQRLALALGVTRLALAAVDAGQYESHTASTTRGVANLFAHSQGPVQAHLQAQSAMLSNEDEVVCW